MLIQRQQLLEALQYRKMAFKAVLCLFLGVKVQIPKEI